MHPGLERIVGSNGKFPSVRLITASGIWGTHPHPNATTVTLNIAGQHVTKQERGNGSIHASFNAIMSACEIEAVLEKFEVDTLQGVGASGVGKVTVWLKYENQIFKGITSGDNVERATVQACIAAVNKLARALRKRNLDQARHRRVTRRHDYPDAHQSASL